MGLTAQVFESLLQRVNKGPAQSGACLPMHLQQAMDAGDAEIQKCCVGAHMACEGKMVGVDERRAMADLNSLVEGAQAVAQMAKG
jgi:hypothetical protein